MSSKPVKSTGGAGFAFETKVDAYFAAAMLAHGDAFRLGKIGRLEFQRRADGWLLDDLAVTLETSGGQAHCAVSVKSGIQFSGGRAPADFVEPAWEQFRGDGCAAYDRDRDLLALACPPLDGRVRADLVELQRLAREQDPAELAARLEAPGYVSEERRRLFESFACPPALAAQHGASRADTARLLRQVRVIEFDWEAVDSRSLDTALNWCRRSLVERDADDAARLWDAILAITGRTATAGGHLEWTPLVDELAPSFQLIYRLDVATDWDVLQELTGRSLDFASDHLGAVHLERSAEAGELAAASSEHRFVAVLGRSGAGKTALTKTWATALSEALLWLRPPDLRELTASLKHSLQDVLRGSPMPAGLIVLDGLDGAPDERTVEEVAHLLMLVERDDALSRWRVVVTCQTQEWPRVLERLARLRVGAIPWKSVDVGPITPAELQIVAKEYPALRSLLHAGTPLVQNLKMLDVVARHIVKPDQPTPSLASEASFSSGFWTGYVLAHPNGRQRAEFLKRLAEHQADHLELETSLRDVADVEVIDDIARDGICFVTDERVSFAHDLLGDCVRHHILVGDRHDLSTYLANRLDSPLWHRAVRLYATGLLEDNADVGPWTQAFRSFGGSAEGVLQDLFLEAIVFSARPAELLERAWPELERDNGALLRRLLRRFQHVATFPNPTIMALFRDMPDLAGHAETMSRLPILTLWLPVLRGLGRHEDSVLGLASHQVAQLTDTWLRQTPAEWPERGTAARLALAAGQRMFDFKSDDQPRVMKIVDGDVDQVGYRAALAAAAELPDEVGRLALKLCARSSDTLPLECEYTSMGTTRRAPSPWPDGPRNRVDSAFRKLCLTTPDALVPLMAAAPEVASEVLLALLIAPPRFREPYALRDLDEELALEDVYEWRMPELPTNGPFLPLLNTAPDETIDMILRLVNFATERRVARFTGDDGVAPHVTVPLGGGDSDWLGDAQMYPWYRGEGAPRALVVPVMALEQWLYTQQDNGVDIEPYLARILEGSRSIVFAGLLAAVGCRRPALLVGTLRPLLAVLEFIFWDRDYKFIAQQTQLWQMGLVLQNDVVRRTAIEWNTLEHRLKDLMTAAIPLLLTDAHMQSFFVSVLEEWREEARRLDEDGGDSLPIRNVIAQFDLTNYGHETDENGTGYWQYIPPEEIRRESEAALRELNQAQAFTQFPMRCRMLLDGKASLDQFDLETFWGQLQELAARNPSQEEEGTVDRDDVACGGAAVLILRHRDWLVQFPDRRAWCVDALLEAAEKGTRPRGILDSPRGIVPWSADYFCSEALPHLWADAPTDRRLRRAVAALARPGRYPAIAALFYAASTRRDDLGDDFARLQHYGLLVAGFEMADVRIKQREDRRRYRTRRGVGGRAAALLHDQFRGPTAERRRLERDRRRATEGFVNSSLETKLPAWGGRVDLTQAGRPAEGTGRSRRRQGRSELDMEYVQHAFAWLPPLAEARDETEREAIIRFWHEAEQMLVTRLGQDMGPDDEVDGTPYESDGWVIRGVAGTIAGMRPEEEPRTMWEPLLRFGSAAHYWIEDFLREWMEVGLSGERVPSTFVSIWRDMIGFTRDAPSWQAEHGRGWAYAAEHRWTLMGLDYLTQRRWLAHHSALVSEMRAEYEDWAITELGNAEAAEHFVEFLKLEAAQPLLESGVVWLAEADAASMSGRYRRQEELPQRLAELLDRVWRQDRTVLRREPVAKAFRDLLRGLVNRQVPMALALADRIRTG
jgi:hypothetical protein